MKAKILKINPIDNAVVALSDLHAGEIVWPPEGSLNSYLNIFILV